MRSTLRCAIGAALVAALAACHPGTGHPACDPQHPQRDLAARLGYKFDCTPPAYFEPHIGWADHKTKTLWIWADRIPTSGHRAVRKTMWHELGHAVVERRGMTFPTHSAEERWADGFAYCKEPIQGVSYLLIPTSCTNYR